MLALLAAPAAAPAAVTPELQRTIRENTFEVVTKKPAVDTATYEKPLPLELLPYIERTDAYRSIGTAFALGNNTYVTAAHVFRVAVGSQFGPPQLRRADGSVFSVDKILKFSIHEDFVVFSLKGDPAPPGLTVNRDPSIDQTVLAVGNALGEGIVIRDGLFTSETPEDQDGRWKWIRFSAAASPGNSGGPLCDEQGRVVGVVIGKSPNENLNYSLPIRLVLDAETSKAHFDEKVLVGMPFLHGTVTYQYQDQFPLPLAWQPFVDAVLKLSQRQTSLGRDKLLKTYADTLFPNGPKTEEVLFDPAVNATEPRLIVQDADGTWHRGVERFHSIALPGDGSIATTTVPGASLIRLIRPNAADDDAFYKDSKAFMDLALKALDLRRPVGTDQVRIVSLGVAKSDEMVTDNYGRKWQQRVWAVPFLDVYVVAELLPTPDGYAGLMVPAPSMAVDGIKDYGRLLINQFDVSYEGTLAQWRAALERKDLLPTSLAGIKLDSSPTWTLQTPRVVSSVPPGLLGLTDQSFLTLTMDFMKDGSRTVWDVQDIRWDRDNARERAVSIWRRARPPESARVELRTRYDNIRSRRMPYDGTLNRDTNEVFSAAGIIDVTGPSAGTLASDVQYGVTVYLVGPPSSSEASRSVADLKAATHVLERGTTKAEPIPPPAGAAPPSAASTPISAAQGVSSFVDAEDPYGPDDAQYVATKRPDDERFPTSITRLTACKISSPSNLQLVEPRYPPGSRRNNEQGTVILQFNLDGISCVRKATIVQSSGFYRLDEASLRFAMLLRFPSSTVAKIKLFDDGQPVIRMPVVFKLTKPVRYNPLDRCSGVGRCVDEPPPPPPTESRGEPPEPGDVWMPGFYVHYPRTGYQWNDGRWETSRPGYHWEAPHWESEHSKWFFVAGEWKKDGDD